VLERLDRYRPTGDGPAGYSPEAATNSHDDAESSTGTADS
jgi:hypothetical protein